MPLLPGGGTLAYRLDELVRGARQRHGDKANIVAAMRSAKFCPKEMPLSEWILYDDPAFASLRGTRHPTTGVMIGDGSSLKSDFMHATKRALQGQFKQGTTGREYVDDLLRAVSRHHSCLRVRVGMHGASRTLKVAVFLELSPSGAPLSHVVNSAVANQSILVIYDAQHDCLASGYLVDTLRVDSLPANWNPCVEVTL